MKINLTQAALDLSSNNSNSNNDAVSFVKFQSALETRKCATTETDLQRKHLLSQNSCLLNTEDVMDAITHCYRRRKSHAEFPEDTPKFQKALYQLFNAYLANKKEFVVPQLLKQIKCEDGIFLPEDIIVNHITPFLKPETTLMIDQDMTDLHRNWVFDISNIFTNTNTDSDNAENGRVKEPLITYIYNALDLSLQFGDGDNPTQEHHLTNVINDLFRRLKVTQKDIFDMVDYKIKSMDPEDQKLFIEGTNDHICHENYRIAFLKEVISAMKVDYHALDYNVDKKIFTYKGLSPLGDEVRTFISEHIFESLRGLSK